MDPKTKWLLPIVLPMVVSCTSSLGLLKQDTELSKLSGSPIENTGTSTEEVASQNEGAFHIVEDNQTLRQICEVYGLELAKVAKVNKILPPYSVKAGDTVFLPAFALLNDGDGLAGKQAGNILSGDKARRTVAGIIRGQRDPGVPDLKFPVMGGVLTSPFGYRWGRLHKGLDIAASVGSPVMACLDGKVLFTGSRKRFRRYGNTVLIDHGKGLYTYYAHLSKILVRKGQAVTKGQKVALVGNTGRSTGPHLHLEVRVGNTMYNPLVYFAKNDLAGIQVAKRFSDSPMGPVRAKWRIPDLLTASR